MRSERLSRFQRPLDATEVSPTETYDAAVWVKLAKTRYSSRLAKADATTPVGNGALNRSDWPISSHAQVPCSTSGKYATGVRPCYLFLPAIGNK